MGQDSTPLSGQRDHKSTVTTVQDPVFCLYDQLYIILLWFPLSNRGSGKVTSKPDYFFQKNVLNLVYVFEYFPYMYICISCVCVVS